MPEIEVRAVSTFRRSVSSPIARITFGVLLGALFGQLMSRIPSPTVAHVFWIGNLCAPWLALSFFSGALQHRRRTAIVAGVLADLACVVGFYWHFLLLGPTALGLQANTTFVHWIVPSLVAWLAFIRVWVAIAVLAGLAYGLLGRWWRRSGTPAAVVALALPFIAEPALWTFRGDSVPLVFWIGEITVGLVVAVSLLRFRHSNFTGGEPSRVLDDQP